MSGTVERRIASESRQERREGVSSAVVLAENHISNEQLAKYLTSLNGKKIDAQRIQDSTGILTRHHLQPLGESPRPLEETVPELAQKALNLALSQKGWGRHDVGVYLAATSYPYGQKLSLEVFESLPITSPRTDLPTLFTRDAYAACSGATVLLHEFHKLAIAKINGVKVALFASEHYSYYLGQDLNLRIFSDGAVALVFSLGRDGDLQILASDEVWEKNPAIRMPVNPYKIPAGSLVRPIPAGVDHFTMDNGASVRQWLQDGPLVPMIGRFARDLNLSQDDRIITHQASRPACQTLQESLEKAGVKTPVLSLTLPTYGNLAAASCLGELDAAIAAGQISAGSKALLVGFGAGLGGAVVAVKFNKVAGLQNFVSQ